MARDGAIDWAALRRLVDWQIAQGTDGIVSVGTTGESPTLDAGEHMEVIRVTVEQAGGRVPVIAGSGANSTREAIEWTRGAAERGADASLQVVPYYNKPSQAGLYAHFAAIAAATDIPLILYNVPGRTVADLSNATALRLAADCANIIGIKDATGDLERGAALIAEAPAGFRVYSGDDETALGLMQRGACGDISVTANVAPALMAELCRLALAGEDAGARARAEQLDARLQPLHRALFIEPSPAPVKWALAQMGLIEGGIRLPMLELGDSAQPQIRQLLDDLELL